MVVDVMHPDAIVIGARLAGPRAAHRPAPRGGRASAFADRESGELVDNGQHILLGCYTETFAFLRDVGADGNVQVEPNLAVTMIDRAGRRSRLSCPSSLPAPFHLAAGVLDW